MGSLDADLRIQALAARTASVVHARGLRAAGVTRGVVSRRVAAGTMTVLLPSTYAVGPLCASPTRDMECMAGVLYAGEDAALDGVTAAIVRGAWNRPDTSIHVTAPGICVRAAPHPYVFHRASSGWPAAPFERVGALPIVDFIEMCFRLAATMTRWQLAFVIDRGIYEGQVRLVDLDRAINRRGRHRGVGTVRAAVALLRAGSVGTRCFTEDHGLAGMLDAGIPTPLVNTRGVMGIAGDEPDFVWPHARLNVEFDGGQHAQQAQLASDRERDRLASSLGWRVLRFDSWRVRRQLRHVVRAIGAVLEGAAVESIAIRRVLDH